MEPESDHALLDDLTGAWNRRALRELFEREWADLVAASGPVALLLLDLDLFKEVNDRHGHLAGDAVLRRTVGRLRDGFRADDRIFRYGGDEFVVVLPRTGGEEASELAGRVREALDGARSADTAGGRRPAPAVSFSVGAAVAPDDGASGDEVLAVADARLYADKRARRQERDRARRRRRFLAALAAAAAVAATGGYLLRIAAPPPPPEVGRPAEVVRPLPDESPEVESLRAEVERLTQALAEQRSDVDRDEYENRIRELETKLGDARRRAEAERVAGAAPEPAIVTQPPAVAPNAPAAAPPPLEAGSRQARSESPSSSSGERPEAPRVDAALAVVVPPQLVRHEAPRYPLLARRRRVQGTVELRLSIGADGSVARAEQVSSRLGFGLDEAAMRSALSAVYRPATRAGEPIAAETTLQIRFVLDDVARSF